MQGTLINPSCYLEMNNKKSCWHTPVAHQQSNTDQQMSFRNR